FACQRAAIARPRAPRRPGCRAVSRPSSRSHSGMQHALRGGAPVAAPQVAVALRMPGAAHDARRAVTGALRESNEGEELMQHPLHGPGRARGPAPRECDPGNAPLADVGSPAVTAVVLAGGRGTRLAPLTAEQAKPAVAFGARHRIIDFALSNLTNSGIDTIHVLVQHHARSILDHLRLAWQPL